MNKYLSALIIFSIVLIPSSYAARLSEHPMFDYQVVFTNPECARYSYAEAVPSNNDTLLTQKPQNAYCTKNDLVITRQNPDIPENRLIAWLRDPSTVEVVISFLSFSNERVRDELCLGIRERNLALRLILDSGSSQKIAEELARCIPDDKFEQKNIPQFYTRGHVSGIDFSHTKLVLINPSAPLMRIVYGSGNLNSMAPLFHENWHFVQIGSDTHFAQIHRCLVDGMINHAGSGADFKQFIKTCRSSIPYPPEEDVTVFVVPGDGALAEKAIFEELEKSSAVDIAAHRFSHKTLIEKLGQKLEAAPSTPIRFVADDDLYWIGKDRSFKLGFNDFNEFLNAINLGKKGMQVKYLETNHNARILHHNKYLIFHKEGPSAVFTGAGNLTKTAFVSNFENFYMIRIPQVVEAFKAQYQFVFEDLATSYEMMPSVNVMP